MKKIQALPKKVFDENFSNEKFIYYGDYACFISILDVDNEETKYDTTIDNFLQVKMWDVERDVVSNGVIKYEKPNDVELLKILDFVNRNKDKTTFIIHCSGGISRSGAVASYIADKFNNEVDRSDFIKNNKQIQPNLYILKRLRKLDNNEIYI